MTKKLHLGCGKRYLPGYIHVDIDKFEHIDYVSDINNLDMFEDNSIELIYASHVLEYWDRIEVNKVLSEWRRVLIPNGILRLAVPNFEKLIDVYKLSNDLEKVLGPLYGRWEPNDDETIYHKTTYDFNSLEKLLISNGYREVNLWDWREVFSEFKDYDDHSQAYYPHMDKEEGILISLNVECKKNN